MDADKFINQVQADVVAHLASFSWFSDIAIIADIRNLSNDQVKREIQSVRGASGKAGAAIVVTRPRITAVDQNVPGPRFRVEVGILCYTHPGLNTSDVGTGKDADAIAIVAMQRMHLSRFFGWTQDFQPDERDPIIIYRDIDDLDGRLLTVRAPAALDVIPHVATPKIVVEDDTATVTCETAHADIYLTLDGTYPHAGNAAAILYVEPVALDHTKSYTLRAAAFYQNLLGSNVQQLIV